MPFIRSLTEMMMSAAIIMQIAAASNVGLAMSIRIELESLQDDSYLK